MNADRKSPDSTQTTPVSNTTETPLQSWKGIAAYLHRTERTARRWEKIAGLPVRRHHNGPRSTVYAYPSELDAWRAAHPPSAPKNQTYRIQWPRGIPIVIGLVLVLAVVWAVYNSPILNPPNALVDANGITLRQVWAEAVTDDTGDVSLDGRFLSFTDWSTGDLAIRDLESEVDRRLTNKGTWLESNKWADTSIISPNGKRIVYGWLDPGAVHELHLLDLSSSETHVIHRCEKGEYVATFGWLPDGKEILVGIRTSNQGRFARLSVSDRTLTPLGTGTPLPPETLQEIKVALSPDGRYLVYNEPKGEAGQRDIFIVPLSGVTGDTDWEDLEKTYLVRHPADDYLATWSADSRHVLFLSDRTGSIGLWMVDVENGRPTGEPELIKNDIGPVRNLIRCTQDGELYYSLVAGMQDIYLLEIDPNNGEVIGQPEKLEGRYVGANRGPAFSSDGRYIAYHFQQGPDTAGPGALSIVIRALDTGTETILRTSLVQRGPVQWFSDSKSLLIVAYRSETQRIIDYLRMDLETGQAEVIRKGKSGRSSSLRPDISPDGNSIYFAELDQTDSVWQFKKLQIKSGREEVICRIPTGKSASGFLLSPDGEEMAWAEMDNNTYSWGVFTRPVKGGSQKQWLTLEQPEYLSRGNSLVWLPNGKHLLVSKWTGEGGQTELLKISVESGQVSSLGVRMEEINFGDAHMDGRVAFWSGMRKDRAKEIWALSGFLEEGGSSK